MKKVITFLALFGYVVYASGQGSIAFLNNSLTLITTNSAPGSATAPISAPGNFYFALFSAPAGTLDPSIFSFTGAYATNRALDMPGRFNGGLVTFPNINPVSLVIRGWSANIGPTYSDATNYLANPLFDAWYGESQIATVMPQGGGFPAPSPFGFNPGQVPGFNLNMYSAVPEPSSVVLGILGGAALFFFRRRARH